MPYAIEARFDPALEQALLAVWAGLEADNVPTPRRAGFRPHLSLALFEDTAEDVLGERLRTWAATTPLLPVQLDAVGVFVSPGDAPGEDAIVWLAPIVSEGLLAVHRRVHESVLPSAIAGPDPRYLPDRWIPHCTLTARVPFSTAALAVRSVLPRFRPPLAGYLVAVDLVRFFRDDPRTPFGRATGEHRLGFPLGEPEPG